MWISVKDRLPEVYVPVLAVGRFKRKRTLAGVIVYEGKRKWWDTEHSRPVVAIVTHWMPLPAPPSSDGKREGE
jgi:hypothetical protein